MSTRFEYGNDHAEEAEDHSQTMVVCRKIFTCFLFFLSAVLFLFIGPCLCFLKMRLRVRILVLWVWLGLLAIFFGLSLRFIVFPGVSHILAPYDQRQLVARTSTLFCSALKVRGSIPVDVYSFEEDPDERHDLFSYIERHDLRIAPDESMMFPFYFLHGSDVNIDVRSVRPIVFIVLRGESAVKRWIRKEYELGSKTTGTKIEVTFRFDESDEYGFAFFNENFDPGGVNETTELSVIFEVRRKRFTLTESKDKCRRTKYCNFFYKFNSYQTVLLDVPLFNRSGKVNNFVENHGDVSSDAADGTAISISRSSFSAAPPFAQSSNESMVAESNSGRFVGLHIGEALHVVPPQGAETSDDNRIPFLYYQCVPNIYVYLFLFVVVPLALGSLGSGVIYVCKSRERDPRETLPLLDDKRPRRRSDIIRKYSNVWLY